jgi:hypothetical protein
MLLSPRHNVNQQCGCVLQRCGENEHRADEQVDVTEAFVDREVANFVHFFCQAWEQRSIPLDLTFRNRRDKFDSLLSRELLGYKLRLGLFAGLVGRLHDFRHFAAHPGFFYLLLHQSWVESVESRDGLVQGVVH